MWLYFITKATFFVSLSGPGYIWDTPGALDCVVAATASSKIDGALTAYSQILYGDVSSQWNLPENTEFVEGSIEIDALSVSFN